MSRAACWLLAALAACGAPPATGPGATPSPRPPADDGSPTADAPAPTIGPDWLRGTPPADLPAAEWVFGAALHADIEEAQARAEVALALDVWGPLAARPTARPLPSFYLPKDDVTRTELVADGQTAVLVAVQRRLLGERMLAWLDQADEQVTSRRHPDTPAGRLAAAIAGAELRMLEAFTCRRLTALAAGECGPPAGGDHPFLVFATQLRLQPQLDGGVPRLPGQPPLRPAGACLRLQSARGEPVPWPDVVLRFDAPAGVLAGSEATTGPDGCATVPFAALPADDLRIVVRVASEPLVGELAADFPDVTCELRLRTVTTRSARVAVHIFEHVLGRPTREAVTGETTVAALRRLGYANSALLDPGLAALLAPAKSGAVEEAIDALRSRAAGAADILVLGEIHSDFLSRAIGRTLWHEATLAVRVVDLWAGKALGELELANRAQGLGDEEAARNAMAETGRQLAERLHQLLGKVNLSARLP